MQINDMAAKLFLFLYIVQGHSPTLERHEFPFEKTKKSMTAVANTPKTLRL